MIADELEIAVASILSHYSRSSAPTNSLSNAGGFSGARLWRIDANDRSYCLKAWPSEISSERLRRLQAWMISARNAGLKFIPEVIRAADGSTCREFGGRLWDLTEWMPGTADFRRNPSAVRIAAACSALAMLHEVWQRAESHVGSCPAVHRRFAALSEWRELLQSGWRPAIGSCELDPAASAAQRAWQILPLLVVTQVNSLESYRNASVHLQPCVCDIWHDHVLFIDDRVSGVIDYGSMRIDTPATDLARLLGNMVGDRDDLFQAGMSGYRAACGRQPPDPTFVRVLDLTGAVIGLTQWLRWLYHDHRQFPDRVSVARRLQELVTRLESHVSH